MQPATEDITLAPLSAIDRNLDRIFEGNSWINYEPETISLELGIEFNNLLLDKVWVLKLLGKTNLFDSDPLFFLHAIDVANNKTADFDTFPYPTSLEIAYGYLDILKIKPDVALKNSILLVVKSILIHEGYSEPVFPFDKMGIKSEDLAKGQEPSDTANKAKAITKYIEAMNG